MITFYKSWQLFDSMPPGWVIDKTCGSPLAGYAFITNGKSVLYGQKRALLRMEAKPENKEINLTLNFDHPKSNEKQIIDSNYTKTVNDLARAKFKLKMLADIQTDLMVCEIEGWNKTEYIKELMQLIGSIGNESHHQTVD